MFLDVNEVRKGRTKSATCDIEQTTDHLAHASIPDAVWFPVPCTSFNYPFFFSPQHALASIVFRDCFGPRGKDMSSRQKILCHS